MILRSMNLLKSKMNKKFNLLKFWFFFALQQRKIISTITDHSNIAISSNKLPFSNLKSAKYSQYKKILKFTDEVAIKLTKIKIHRKKYPHIKRLNN